MALWFAPEGRGVSGLGVMKRPSIMLGRRAQKRLEKKPPESVVEGKVRWGHGRKLVTRG